MASNFPTPMPQAGAPFIDLRTGNLTIAGYRWAVNVWNRTGGDAGSNSTSVLQAANNLSDVVSVSQSRLHLGLGSAATQSVTAFLQPTNNLSDLTSDTTARTNLGLGDAATHAASDFATAAQGAKADTALQPNTAISVTTVSVSGNQVLGARITGWGTPSGGSRGSGAAYAGQTMGAAYDQTKAQANDDALKALSQKFTALIADLETQGLIGT